MWRKCTWLKGIKAQGFKYRPKVLQVPECVPELGPEGMVLLYYPAFMGLPWTGGSSQATVEISWGTGHTAHLNSLQY